MSSTTYRQLILRLPDGLKHKMRDKVMADVGLAGVDFTPDKKGSRRFTFTMDDKVYPARLVDLPCVLETQKTLDKTTFFKSGDVGQMLIVYKDENAYRRDESHAPGVGQDELYPDGLTPPTKNIVRRRFRKARPDRQKFNRTEVIRVESQVLKMQHDGSNAEGGDKKKLAANGISSAVAVASSGIGGSSRSSRPGGGDSAKGRNGGGSGGGGGVGGSGSSGGNGGGGGEKVTFEHEEIVEFEPWMADPDIATLGRLEGITIEITGPTEKSDADDAGRGSLSHPAPLPPPRLFGSELLYEHPEILLAVADLVKDSGARTPEQKEKVEGGATTSASFAIPTGATAVQVTREVQKSADKQRRPETALGEAQRKMQKKEKPRQDFQPKHELQEQKMLQQQLPKQIPQQLPQQQLPQQQLQQPQQPPLQQPPSQQPQQPQQLLSVEENMTVPTGTDPQAPGTELESDPDVSLSPMDDPETLDELGVEDIFSGVLGELTDGAAVWQSADDEELPTATGL